MKQLREIQWHYNFNKHKYKIHKEILNPQNYIQKTILKTDNIIVRAGPLE